MPSPIEDIKSRIDIVELIQGYVRLQKAGINYRAVCPFHSEKTPSFFVSPTRQIWHCFGGCNKGGDIFRFIMEIEGYDFPEALKLLAERAGVRLTREDPAIRSERNRLYDINECTADIFERTLLVTSPVKEYLKKRGVGEETVRSFRIGFAPDAWDFLITRLTQKGFRPAEIEKAGMCIKSQERSSYYDRFRNRIMFPIRDGNGRVIGFGGRIFESGIRSQEQESGRTEAKYINTPQTLIYDKSRVLYGFDKAKNDIRTKNRVVVVEGYMDCVMSHQAGVKNTVAVSGIALTLPQLEILRRMCDTMASSFDTDAAGESATKRSLALAAEFGFDRRVVAIPSGKDPADTVLEDPASWVCAVENAQPIAEFYFEKALRIHDPKSADGKKQIAAILLPIIAELQDEIEKAHWVKELAGRLGVPEEAVRKDMSAMRADPRVPYSHAETARVTELPVPRRKELLEERFLALLMEIGEEEKIAELAGRHFSFLSPLRQKIFDSLMRGDNQFPDDLKEEVNMLRFRREVLAVSRESIAQEFTAAKRELEKTCIKDELKRLGGEIEQHEREKNETHVTVLLHDFRKLSELLKTIS
ncbi:MAG: DNA primase [Parcubacteria group bacterium Gr01-1014_33]|nr:MAG: DNA primase [Parcubacteria group bacterium Gr01-1014_33]